MCHYGQLTNPKFGIFSPGYYTLHTSYFILRTKRCTHYTAHYTLATFPAFVAMAIGIDKAIAMTVAMAVENA